MAEAIADLEARLAAAKAAQAAAAQAVPAGQVAPAPAPAPALAAAQPQPPIVPAYQEQKSAADTERMDKIKGDLIKLYTEFLDFKIQVLKDTPATEKPAMLTKYEAGLTGLSETTLQDKLAKLPKDINALKAKAGMKVAKPGFKKH